MKSGLQQIEEERTRQIKGEGFLPEADDRYTKNELRIAGHCYQAAAMKPMLTLEPPCEWPWVKEWWKPLGGPVRLLAKAGALYWAENARIRRKYQREGSSQGYRPVLELGDRLIKECADAIDRIQREGAEGEESTYELPQRDLSEMITVPRDPQVGWCEHRLGRVEISFPYIRSHRDQTGTPAVTFTGPHRVELAVTNLPSGLVEIVLNGEKFERVKEFSGL